MKQKRCPLHSYQKIEAFDAQLPKKHNKFFTTERRSIAGDIYHRAKKKETSSPSPHEYNPDVWKKRASYVKPLGNYKLTSKKITFAEEAQFIFGENPMPGKYEAMQLDKLKTKPRYTKINETLQRFKKDDKDNKPSPLSYDVAGAIQATQWKKENK